MLQETMEDSCAELAATPDAPGPSPGRWLLAAMLGVLGATPAAAACAGSIAELRQLTGDGGFSVHWVEIGMDDGKPLHLLLTDHADGLHLRFQKMREGRWAEGAGAVCASGEGFEARFEAGRLQPGPAAHLLLRQALKSGGRFRLTRSGPGALDVATLGWRGRFVAAQAATP